MWIRSTRVWLARKCCRPSVRLWLLVIIFALLVSTRHWFILQHQEQTIPSLRGVPDVEKQNRPQQQQQEQLAPLPGVKVDKQNRPQQHQQEQLAPLPGVKVDKQNRPQQQQEQLAPPPVVKVDKQNRPQQQQEQLSSLPRVKVNADRQKRPLVVIYNSEDMGIGELMQKGDRRCEFTHDHKLVKRAQMVWVYPAQSPDEEALRNRQTNQYWVWTEWEAWPVRGNANQYHYNLTMSYRVDSDIRGPYIDILISPKPQFPYDDVKPDEEGGEQFYEPWTPMLERYKKLGISTDYAVKKKHVAWLVANCNPTNKRMEIAKALQRHGVNLDIYGKCGTMSCGSRESFQGEDCWTKLGREYLFYYAAENDLCRDYITEKPRMPLMFNLVPLVHGGLYDRADYIGQMPPNSFLHVADFADTGELAKRIIYLANNRTAYEEYTAWQKNYFIANYNTKTRTFGMMFNGRNICQYLIDALANGPTMPKRHRDHINEWWDIKKNCKKDNTKII